MRYSPLAQIHRGNVARLRVAWTYRTGEAMHGDTVDTSGGACDRCHGDTQVKFEATPILVAGRLVLSTPLNRVIALDPATGRELWRHDPVIDREVDRNEGFVSRGVAYWEDRVRPDATCGRRILFGTIDARLLALDAITGRPCAGFGSAGTVRLDRGVGEVQVGQYGVTSPPAVAGDLVIVGSSMGDNRRVDMERGTVRAYDARTGALRWAWDPIPRSPADAGWGEWDPAAAARTGAGNAWAPLSVDTARGLVFVPTGAAAPDFYGGERPGDNRFANSVVALDAATGSMRWHFQVVHHDLWDYDVAAQPSLVSLRRSTGDVPAVAVPTKMGLVFVLDRETGAPLFPVEERPVRPSDVPGERASPTQPFPTRPPPLHPIAPVTEADLWGLDAADSAACRAALAELRSGGLYTPPSLDGTLLYPSFAGGMNWGGAAFDPARRRLMVNTMRFPFWVRLAPRRDPNRGNQRGTPYTMTRAPFVSPRGIPCTRPPWGTLVALDLDSGAVRWEVPLGRMAPLRDVPGSDAWGSINIGGPIVTAGGLVLIGAANDDFLRAFDVETGRELWRGALPAGGQATPMTYAVDGRQYVVIAAGGHSGAGTTFGDHVVAFALDSVP
jgi:quinoprotein glucose dehydrogenase